MAVYLDDGFFDHPKVVAAGDDATLMHIHALAYCSRNNTKGFVPKGIVRRLTERASAKLATVLVDAGLWEVVSGGWQIHDYELFNAAQIARRDKAKKAAEARWSKVDAQASSEHDAPAMNGHLPEHVLSTCHQPQPQPQPQRTAAASLLLTHDGAETVVAAALEILAKRRPPAKTNPGGYRKAILTGLANDHANTLTLLDWNQPWTAETLADWLEPSGTITQIRDLRPYDYQEKCPTCHDRAIYDVDAEGFALPCPDCQTIRS